MIRIGATNVKIEGLELDGTDKADDGVITSAAVASGFTAKNMTVYNCAYGLSTVSNSNITIEGCSISLIASGGIRVHNVTPTQILTNWRVINNKIDLSDLTPATATQIGLLVRGDTGFISRNVIVTGNQFIHCIDPTASGAENCEIRFCDGVVFANNNAYGGSMMVSVVGTKNASITGNVGTNQTFYGIELGGVTAITAENITVSGNTIDGDGILGYGIGLQGSVAACKGASISGNSIEGTQLYGIFSNTNWSNLSITGNRISITYATGGAQFGIYLSGSINTASIVGNELHGNSQAEKAINIVDATNVSISGNSTNGWTQNEVYINSATAVDVISITGNAFGSGLAAGAIGTTGAGTFGEKITAFGNSGYRLTNTENTDIRNLFRAVYEVQGTGTPESSVTAGVGSVYHRRDGGAATCLYIKETGTGNTGWVAK
jgi:hypothetical protein